MEEQRKIKPIFPQHLTIKTQFDYVNFMKKRLKGQSKIELRKVDRTTNLAGKNANYSNLWTAKFLRVAKNLKYVKKLALSGLVLCFTSYYLSKMLYFAKRMINSQIIQLNDFLSPEQRYQGTFGRFVRYIKNAQSFHYDYTAQAPRPRDRDLILGLLKHKQDFIHLLKHQPHLKDLKIQFLHQSQAVTDEYWNLQRYPATLERFSLTEAFYDKSIMASFKHMENLKSLAVDFHYQAKPDFITSILHSIPVLSSHLQNLSLSINDIEMPSIFTAFAGMRTLNNLTQLKLDLKPHQTKNFQTVLASFTECPLKILNLRTIVESEEYVISIIHFIKKFPNLEDLELEVKCHKAFNSFDNVKQVLQEIDNLALLRKLAVSIAPRSEKNKLFLEISPIFTKIFSKAIPLDSFKIQIQSMKISNQGFLQLLKDLKPLASNLKDLEIDIGEYKPDKNESEKVLGFIKSLQNISSLKLVSLSIPLRQFFNELAETVNGMPNIRTLVLGEIKGAVTKNACMDIVERIIKKRGLEEFGCFVSDVFKQTLDKKEKKCPKILLSQVYKVNPFLKKHSSLPIFDIEEKGPKQW